MVLSRALSLAAVTLVVGSWAIGGADAQENLDAGKSPSQIFGGTCTACHKSARGLLKTVAPGSLQGFLRQHYTTSPEMAGVLASYLISNGAADTRYGDKKGGKDGREAKSDARSAKPESGSAPAEAERTGHNAKRAARPAEPPAAGNPAAEGQVAPGTSEHEGRKSKRHGKHGVGDEVPKASERPVEPAKEDAAGGQPAKSEAAKPETTKPEAANSGEAGKPIDNPKAVASPAQSSANAGPAKEPVNEALPPSLRPDPVPPVTPAPAAAAPAPANPTAASNARASAPAPAATPAPLSVTVSAPPPPAQPTTPPDPPLSR